MLPIELMLPKPASCMSLITASLQICNVSAAPSVEFVHVMSIFCNMDPNSNAQRYVFVIIFKHLNKGRIHENIKDMDVNMRSNL